MSFMNFTPEINVNNESLNEQHRRIFKTLNILFRSISRNESSSDIRTLFENFVCNFLRHTIYEEKIINNMPDPLCENHIDDHAMFLGRMTGYMESFENEEYVSYSVMLNFINNWFINHIITFDQSI